MVEVVREEGKGGVRGQGMSESRKQRQQRQTERGRDCGK